MPQKKKKGKKKGCPKQDGAKDDGAKEGGDDPESDDGHDDVPDVTSLIDPHGCHRVESPSAPAAAAERNAFLANALAACAAEPNPYMQNAMAAAAAASVGPPEIQNAFLEALSRAVQECCPEGLDGLLGEADAPGAAEAEAEAEGDVASEPDSEIEEGPDKNRHIMEKVADKALRAKLNEKKECLAAADVIKQMKCRGGNKGHFTEKEEEENELDRVNRKLYDMSVKAGLPIKARVTRMPMPTEVLAQAPMDTESKENKKFWEDAGVERVDFSEEPRQAEEEMIQMAFEQAKQLSADLESGNIDHLPPRLQAEKLKAKIEKEKNEKSSGLANIFGDESMASVLASVLQRAKKGGKCEDCERLGKLCERCGALLMCKRRAASGKTYSQEMSNGGKLWLTRTGEIWLKSPYCEPACLMTVPMNRRR